MDPVALVRGPAQAPDTYRCQRCGTRQLRGAAPSAGGFPCGTCGADLHVTDQVTYAGLGVRMLSLIVDAAVLSAGYMWVSFFVSFFTAFDDVGRVGAAVLVSVLAGYLYVGEAIGQTIGKRVCGLRVVTAQDWGAPGAWRGLARLVLAIASLLPLGAGYMMILFDSERRAFHDRVTGTRVIDR
ncbi:MAG: RDD family protein [Dehalococcoidia bacterium]